jgi:hypothetical protein
VNRRTALTFAAETDISEALCEELLEKHRT